MNEIDLLFASLDFALAAFNICFSLHMKKKESSLWWTNLPVAAFCFCCGIMMVFK